MNDINGLHIAVLIISGFFVIFLLFFLKRSKPAAGTQKIEAKTKPCPLCNEMLKPGERVHSVLYPGKPDSLMEIFGCPYCEPDRKDRAPGQKVMNKRICPVCKKEMPSDGLVIARVFEKPGKKHVHVLGCSSCYSGRTKTSR